MNGDMVGASWPPPYEGMVAAPAGEPASFAWPSANTLDRAHKSLQVLFMGLALLGLILILSNSGLRTVLRGAAKKHAIA